jgi:hypothetical protein
MERIQ